MSPPISLALHPSQCVKCRLPYVPTVGSRLNVIRLCLLSTYTPPGCGGPSGNGDGMKTSGGKAMRRLDLLIRVLLLGRAEGILSQCENNSIIEGSYLEKHLLSWKQRYQSSSFFLSYARTTPKSFTTFRDRDGRGGAGHKKKEALWTSPTHL